MKKNQLQKLLSITFLLLSGGIANASISLGFSNPIQAGNSLDISVVISGLGSESSPSLASYDLDIQFDGSHLSFANASFGDPILGNQLDLLDFGLNDTSATLAEAGIANIYEVSLDDTADLNDFQANSFTLAVLTFDILKASTSQMELVIHDLGDANDNLLSADLVAGTITTVPLPSGIWLMASGIVMFFRKKG